ncbi:hypothetical protein ACTFIR_009433 [Dictyostelium discoideum]
MIVLSILEETCDDDDEGLMLESIDTILIPKSIDQTISRVKTNTNSTTLETGDYLTFQSHVYCSSYTRFRNFFNDPFITRIITGIHKLRSSSAKYQEICNANQVFKHLSTIKVIPKYTFTAILNNTFVLCKMFGLERSPDLVKWSFNDLIIIPNSIKGPVINSKEQRKGVLSILELTSLDDNNSQVCPVRHLSTYLRASKGRRNPHSGDSVFI